MLTDAESNLYELFPAAEALKPIASNNNKKTLNEPKYFFMDADRNAKTN